MHAERRTHVCRMVYVCIPSDTRMCAVRYTRPSTMLIKWFKVGMRWKHQYLHRTGLTSVKLPADFLFSATREYLPRRVLGVSAQHSIYIVR